MTRTYWVGAHEIFISKLSSRTGGCSWLIVHSQNESMTSQVIEDPSLALTFESFVPYGFTLFGSET